MNIYLFFLIYWTYSQRSTGWSNIFENGGIVHVSHRASFLMRSLIYKIFFISLKYLHAKYAYDFLCFRYQFTWTFGLLLKWNKFNNLSSNSSHFFMHNVFDKLSEKEMTLKHPVQGWAIIIKHYLSAFYAFHKLPETLIQAFSQPFRSAYGFSCRFTPQH